MTHELVQKIRAELNEFCASDICAAQGYAALIAVLDEHPLNDDHECVKEIIGYSVQAWYRDEPCPTVLAIAKGLGLLDDEEDETWEAPTGCAGKRQAR